MRTKRFIVLVFAIFSLNTGMTQTTNDLKSWSIEQLQAEKKKAIDLQNYSRAQEITLEINRRKSIADYLTEEKDKLETAKREERFEEAVLIKGKIDFLQKSQIDLDEALSKEDYLLAERIKNEVFDLMNGVKISSKAVSSVKTENTSNPTNANTLKLNDQTEIAVSKEKKIIPTAAVGLDWMKVRFECPTCTGTVVTDYNSKTGYYAMYGLRVKPSENSGFALEPEIGLASYGWKAFDPQFPNSDPYRSNFFVLRTNAMLKGGIKSILVYRAGLGLDYILAGKNILPSGKELDIIEDSIYERGNVGIIFGTGLNLTEIFDSNNSKKIGKFFELNIDYFKGLKNIEGKKDTEKGEKSFHSHIRLSIKSNF